MVQQKLSDQKHRADELESQTLNFENRITKLSEQYEQRICNLLA